MNELTMQAAMPAEITMHVVTTVDSERNVEPEPVVNLLLTEIALPRYNYRRTFNEVALNELAASIKVHGVKQPICVRPLPPRKVGKYVQKYEIVYGERRFRASIIAGQTHIPCQIRNLSDVEAIDEQLLENILREDTHPLDETNAFEKLLDSGRYTRQDLAHKIGKSIFYIDSRLQLANLIPNFKEVFYDGGIGLTHGMIIAKLPEAGQKMCLRFYNERNGRSFNAKDLENYISRHFECSLERAGFPLEDETILPKAGACTNCSKRSGCAVLFAEAAKDDRCFDRGCFEAKTASFIQREVDTISSGTETIHLLKGYGSTGLSDQYKEQGFQVLTEYNDFQVTRRDVKKGTALPDGLQKGLFIDGNEIGMYCFIRINQKTSQKIDVANGEINTVVEIAKVKQRLVRGVELDDEKVYAKILESLQSHSTQEKPCTVMNDMEQVFLWFIVYDKAGYQLKSLFDKCLGLKEKNPENVFNALLNITEEQKAFLVRKVMLDSYGGLYPTSSFAFIIRKIAETYGDIPIDTFEASQKEKRDKREANAAIKIASLEKLGQQKQLKLNTAA